MKKYIFVTGGVCSSLGKGIAAASIGTLLESRGFRISMIKIDPYLNVDAGTMSPYQHGEVYVTDDGAETDLDLGNYARFTSSPLSKANSITTGQIYQTVINKEREGKYLGKTVQVIPHITDEIKAQILRIGNSAETDITIVEVGGTVGDIESVPFLETARQCIHELGHENVLSVHLTLVPTVSGDEMKTKPTQHSVKELREIGIQPDILLCRAKKELDEGMRKKIANFTNVDVNSVLSAIDVNTTIYEIPLIYHQQKLDEIVLKKLGLELRPAMVDSLAARVEGYKNAKKTVTIAMVGKYVDLHDTYKSIDEALVHAGMGNEVRVRILKIDAEKLEKSASPQDLLGTADGILVPGGFGARGIEGMIIAAIRPRDQEALLRHLPWHADHGHRVRPQRAGPRGGQLHRVQPPVRRPRGEPPRRARRHHQDGRHDAPGPQRHPHPGQDQDPRGLRLRGGLGEAPAPLRVRQPLPGAAGGGRAGHYRLHPRRPVGREHRMGRPPVEHGGAVPPRVHLEAHGAPTAVPGLRPRLRQMKPGAGVLLLFLFLGLDACTLDYGKDKTTPADQVPLMSFENLRQTTVKNGKILYTVESEGSESFPSHKQVRLKRFRFQEYDSQGKAASEGEAESAVIDTATNDATVAGRLRARSAEQKVTLVVDGGPGGGLAWADGDRILKTLANTPVVLTKDDGSRMDAKVHGP